jgi:hypothetical protein
MFGLVGAAMNNMAVRDIGIVGYAVVLPVVLLVMARLFAATPAQEEHPMTDPSPGPTPTTTERGAVHVHT